MQSDVLAGFPLEMLTTFASQLIRLGAFVKQYSVANTPSLHSGGPDAVQPGKKRGQGAVAREQKGRVGLGKMGTNQLWRRPDHALPSTADAAFGA